MEEKEVEGIWEKKHLRISRLKLLIKRKEPGGSGCASCTHPIIPVTVGM